MSSNEFNTALTPVMQSHFDTIIKPKDRNDGVTEGELFAGVAYHAIIEQSGAAAGREYLKMVNDERAKGSGLFTAAKVALNKMGKFFAKTKFKSKKDAAKLGENLEREIRNTASASAQLDGKAGVSNRKASAKDLTEAYQTAAAAYAGRQAGVETPADIPVPEVGQGDKENKDSAAGGTGSAVESPTVNGGSSTEPELIPCPESLERYKGLWDALQHEDHTYNELLKEYETASPERRSFLMIQIQESQSRRKELRELLSTLAKQDNDSVMAVIRNLR